MTAETIAPTRPGAGEYVLVGAVIASGVAAILWAARAPEPVDPEELIAPMCAMFALTAVVWLLMAIFRNAAILFGAATVSYFRDYRTDQPHAWVERPARVFNNLMQVPNLFYVIALLAIATRGADSGQISLAWLFVAMRAAHAIIFMVWNHVPLRFAAYAVSCIVVAVMWGRFALAQLG